jgi:protein-disulfide isomerase
MPYKKALYMMEERKNGASVSDEDRVLAGGNILDTKKLAECIKEKRYLNQVRSEMKEGQDLGVNGTPSVFFDGKKLDNSVFRDLAALKTVMNRLLETPTAPTVPTSPSTPAPSGTGTPE